MLVGLHAAFQAEQVTPGIQTFMPTPPSYGIIFLNAQSSLNQELVMALAVFPPIQLQQVSDYQMRRQLHLLQAILYKASNPAQYGSSMYMCA